MARRVLLLVAVVALLVACVQIAIGGFRFEAAGLRVSNNSTIRPLASSHVHAL